MPTSPSPSTDPSVASVPSAPGPKANPDLEAAFDLAYYTPLQEYRSAADTKAGALLTASGLLFTLLARYSSHVMALMTPGSAVGAPAGLFLGGFVLFSLATAVYAFHTISPRFPDAPPSLAFFVDIASLTREEYIDRVESLDQPAALGELLGYNHTLSTIIAEKFRQLNRAIRFFRVAGLCWLGLIALVSGHLLLG